MLDEGPQQVVVVGSRCLVDHRADLVLGPAFALRCLLKMPEQVEGIPVQPYKIQLYSACRSLCPRLPAVQLRILAHRGRKLGLGPLHRLDPQVLLAL